MSNLSSNLKSRLDALGWSQRELAEKIGITQVTIHNLVSGKSERSRYIVDIAAALGCEVQDLYSDKVDAVSKRGLSNIEHWDDKSPLQDSDIFLPYYREVQLSAGSGRTEVMENNGPKLKFSRASLSKAGVTPENAACCTVSGDSMVPILPEGSTIGIDTSITTISDGKIYAVDHDGMLRVKFLYRIPGGSIKIRSANPDYQDEVVFLDDDTQFRIIGRAFWYGAFI